MKIRDERVFKKEFCEIENGTVFGRGGNILIKIESSRTRGGIELNAISLKDGSLFYMSNNETVTLLDAEVVVR